MKNNKLARRGLTTALAVVTALSMAAPVMANTEGYTDPTTPTTPSTIPSSTDTSTLAETVTLTDAKGAVVATDNYVYIAGAQVPATYKYTTTANVNTTSKYYKSVDYVATVDTAHKNLVSARVDVVDGQVVLTVTGAESVNGLLEAGQSTTATVTVTAYAAGTNYKTVAGSTSCAITLINKKTSGSIYVADKTATVRADGKTNCNIDLNTAASATPEEDVDTKTGKSANAITYYINDDAFSDIMTACKGDYDAATKYYTVTSSDPSVASVSAVKTGSGAFTYTVTGLKVGTTTITVSRGATANYEAAKNVTYTVTVKDTDAKLVATYKKIDGTTATVDGDPSTAYAEDGIYLDLTTNTASDVDATAADACKITYTRQVKDPSIDIFTVDPTTGAVKLTADATSFAAKLGDTPTLVGYVVVKATGTTAAGIEEESVKIPVYVSKRPASYLKVTGLTEDTDKRTIDGHNYKEGIATYDLYLYNDKSEGSEYERDNEKHCDCDYFYQLSTKDDKTVDLSQYVATNSTASLVYSVEASVNAKGEYMYNDNAIVSVSANGVVTANAAGSAYIKVKAVASDATVDSSTTYIHIDVSDKYKYNTVTAPETITLYGVENVTTAKAIGATVAYGDAKQTLVYGLYDADMKPVNTNNDCTLDTANKDLTIDCVNGTIKMNAANETGVAYIAVRAAENGQALQNTSDATKYIKVVYKPLYDNTITVADKAEVTTGETTTVAATATSGTVTYTSADPSIATVDANGVITGVAAGTTTIKVANTGADKKYDTAETKTILVTVKANTLEVANTAYAMAPGETADIAAKTDAKAGATYESADPSVATVDANGKITAVAAGTTTITVKAGTATPVTVAVAVQAEKEVPVETPVDVVVLTPTNLKVAAVGGGKIKVTAKKADDNLDGYKVKYTISGDEWKVVTVKSTANLSKVVSGLTKGQTYKVKVRAYKDVDGKRVFSKFTTVKKVTVK